MRVSLPLILLLLPACGSLSGEDSKRLSTYQRQAQLYWEGAGFTDDLPVVRKKLDQCLEQTERGLAIDSDNYKLLTLKAWVRLRQSNIPGTAGARELNEAEALFARVYETRSPVRHEKDLLLGYAMALEAQGLRNLGEAQRLNAEAAKVGASDAAIKKAKAAEHEELGRSKHLARAREVLAALDTRGDLPRICYFHQMQVAAALGEKDATVALGRKYLETTRKDQKNQQEVIAKTPSLAFEKEQREQLKKMQREEIDVRDMLAELHFLRREYERALEHLQVILTMDPGRKVDYFNRGRCLRELGRAEEAKADFRKFLATSDLPPGDAKMTEAVRALESS